MRDFPFVAKSFFVDVTVHHLFKPTEAPGERGQQPPDASLFAEAREDLKNNNIKEADIKMSKFIKKNLATFQYLFDMALVYSPVEMLWVEPDKVGAGAGGSGKGKVFFSCKFSDL